MTMAQSIENYNANLDRGQYPTTATRSKVGDQVYHVTLEEHELPDDCLGTMVD